MKMFSFIIAATQLAAGIYAYSHGCEYLLGIAIVAAAIPAAMWWLLRE